MALHLFISLFKKYLFGLVVFAYVISAAGIPIYLHYCGGTLEKINYVVKSKSCCGGDESDAADSCCKNENVVLKNNIDFTLRQLCFFDDLQAHDQLLFTTLPYSTDASFNNNAPVLAGPVHWPPPNLYKSRVIAVTMLRI